MKLVFPRLVSKKIPFGPLHRVYQTTPRRRCLLAGRRGEKLGDHGVDRILTLLSVTMETCEWNPPALTCETQSRHRKEERKKKKVEEISRTESVSFYHWSLIKKTPTHSDAHVHTHTHTAGFLLMLWLCWVIFSNYLWRGNPFCSATNAAFSLAMCHDVYFGNDSRWIIPSGLRQQKNSREPVHNGNTTLWMTEQLSRVLLCGRGKQRALIREL